PCSVRPVKWSRHPYNDCEKARVPCRLRDLSESKPGLALPNTRAGNRNSFRPATRRGTYSALPRYRELTAARRRFRRRSDKFPTGLSDPDLWSQTAVHRATNFRRRNKPAWEPIRVPDLLRSSGWPIRSTTLARNHALRNKTAAFHAATSPD